MTAAEFPRRSFTAHVAIGALSGLAVASAPADSQFAAAADRPEQATKAEEDRSSVDLVLGLIRAQYPTPLDDAQWAELRSHVEFHQARARMLRALPLQNGDELPIVFRVFDR